MTMHEIPESDWKRLRHLKEIALDRLCERILVEVAASCDVSGSRHERFLDVFSRVQDGNAEIAMIFDNLRRSNAISRLGLMRAHKLMTGDEFCGFSEETRKAATLVSDARVVIMEEVEKEVPLKRRGSSRR
ncbi:MAG: peptide ABC transporter substrate-binding protein [Elusimicrobia bacterium]|nr:peptide ABC transporter substrate-binding protein [Elusimicrobiota bacterium]